MVLDTSVLLHIAFAETGWEASLDWLSRQPTLCLSVFALVECQAALLGRGAETPEEEIDGLLAILRADVVALDRDQAQLARTAYRRYGKGRGHPAQLNLGDVVTYALAAARWEPLAFVGNDFAHTDLETVRFPRPAL